MNTIGHEKDITAILDQGQDVGGKGIQWSKWRPMGNETLPYSFNDKKIGLHNLMHSPSICISMNVMTELVGPHCSCQCCRTDSSHKRDLFVTVAL